MERQEEPRDRDSNALRSVGNHLDAAQSPPENNRLSVTDSALGVCSPNTSSFKLVTDTAHKHITDGDAKERSAPERHENYKEGFSTEKEIPDSFYIKLSSPTPDYSRPQVVPWQYADRGRSNHAYSSSGYVATAYSSTPIRPHGFHEHIDSKTMYENHEPVPPETPAREDRRCGMKKRIFFTLIPCLIIMLLALILAIGLGVGLIMKKSVSDSLTDPLCRTTPEYCIGGALNSKYFSTKGAFNGTGIALAGESVDAGERHLFTLFYQNYAGDVRFLQYKADRKWSGGTNASTIITDAKLGTPLSTVLFNINGTVYTHVFYIDNCSQIKQVIKTNTTGKWTSGPLSNLHLKAFNSPSVGMQACWKGSFYGDSDFSKFPTSNGQINTQSFDEQHMGMNFWYAVDESTFEQYAWYNNGQDTWVFIQRWRGFNGYAGVGCYSWGPGTTTYAMLSNQKNALELWWKDTNTSTASQEMHPINSWQNSTSGAIRDINPLSSFGYTTYLYAQMADRTIKGYNVLYNAENTSVILDSAFSITDLGNPVAGLRGTHLTVTAYTEMKGNQSLWDSLYVFYQTVGDDITAFTRPISGGEWTKGYLTIPE